MNPFYDGTTPIDDSLVRIMDVALAMATAMRPDVPTEILKGKILANNLRALVHALLLADEKPDEMEVNLKQVALGLLATADWIDSSGLEDIFPPSGPDALFS